MNYNKSFNFLKNLPLKLNSFYKKKSNSGIKVNNKSKSKKDFDPVTNFDKAFEKYIRSLINKKFPKDAIIGEEFSDKFSDNNYKWSVDPIDGTRAFVIGAIFMQDERVAINRATMTKFGFKVAELTVMFIKD